MNELSLFSGAGGGLLGTKWLLGWRTIGYVEIEPFCQEILKARIADGYLDAAPIFGDIRAFIADGYADAYQGMVDVVTGGFPCQDISLAGKKRGIEGPRSGLWNEMATVVRTVRPRHVVVENSPMLTLWGLGRVLGDLAEMGFDAEWGVLSAKDHGLPHERKRIWIVAHSVRWIGPNRRYFRRSRGKQESPPEYPDWENVYKPGFLGKPHGIPNRVDRLKAIGNGQVPRVVKRAWEVLTWEQ
jgi:DNA (cytosine-5)-methyltransferase 1